MKISRTKSYFDAIGVKPGLSGFGDSLTLQNLEPSTRISNILAKYQVTGILPDRGRATLPADMVFGGITFDEVSERLTQASEEDYNDLASALSGDSQGSMTLEQGAGAEPSAVAPVSSEAKNTDTN